MEHTTVNDRRFLLWVISCVQPQDTELKEYELPLKEFAELSGISPANIYAEARKICKRVMALVVELEGFDDSGFEESTMFNLIHKATHKKASGTAIVKIHEDMAPFLLDQKGSFSQIKIAYYMPLRSNFSQLLYEQIKTVEWRTNKATYTLEELREALEVKEGSYQKRFSVFEQKVIKQAVNEITDKTDIILTYEKIKRGRKIHQIVFTFVSKPEQSEIIDIEPVSDDLAQNLISYGVTAKKAKKYAKDHPERVKNALLSLKKQKKVDKPAGWLVRAIEENWQDPELVEKNRLKEVELKRRKVEALVKQAEEKENLERDQYWSYTKQAVSDVVSSLSEEKETELRAEFENISPPLFGNKNDNKGLKIWTSPMQISNAKDFLSEKVGAKFKTQEEFFKQ